TRSIEYDDFGLPIPPASLQGRDRREFMSLNRVMFLVRVLRNSPNPRDCPPDDMDELIGYMREYIHDV
ncbi:hypothetical protein Anas_09706, partial [Armadillidium nasatum]